MNNALNDQVIRFSSLRGTLMRMAPAGLTVLHDRLAEARQGGPDALARLADEIIKEAEFYALSKMRDIDAVAIAATDYCVGRSTYAVNACVTWLALHWSDLSEMARKTIQERISTALAADQAGDKHDLNEWRDLLAILREHEPDALESAGTISGDIDQTFKDAVRKVDAGLERGMAWARYAFAPSVSRELIDQVGARLFQHYMGRGYKCLMDMSPAALDIRAEFRLLDQASTYNPCGEIVLSPTAPSART